MIYSPGRFLFVHIPRTGGMTLTAALSALLPEADLLVSTTGKIGDNLIHRHSTIVDLFAWGVPVDDRRLFCFTIVRSPWDIIASDYRLTLRDAERRRLRPSIAGVWQKPWIDRLDRLESDPSVAGFIQREYEWIREPGGFYRHWCGDIDLIKPYKLIDLDRRWHSIATLITEADRRLLRRLPTNLPRENEGQAVGIQWGPREISAVRELCHDDISRFEFKAPANTVTVARPIQA